VDIFCALNPDNDVKNLCNDVTKKITDTSDVLKKIDVALPELRREYMNKRRKTPKLRRLLKKNTLYDV